MILTGVSIGFIISIYLIYKKINMGLSLLIGATIIAIFSALGIKLYFLTIFNGILNYVVIQLIIVVALITGLGYILKETRDLDKMINALISIFKDARVLTIIMPMLIGTLSVPGGAILSAPMVEESGSKIGLDKYKLTVINLFFRHIGFFVYPLYSSMILTSELLNISKIMIIRYNVFIMLIGFIIGYYLYFKGVKSQICTIKSEKKIIKNLLQFILSFLPIIIILILAIVIKLPFYLAVIIGLTLAILKNPSKNAVMKEYKRRITGLFTDGIRYDIVLIIAGIMVFKAVIEASGAINIIAAYLSNSSFPLPVVILVLGFITAYATGSHIAATGLLATLFYPMIPTDSLGPYISLLFTAIFVGYLLSPLHLCLVLTKEYFKVELMPIYRLLAFPVIAMLFIAFIKIYI
jgi:uncharacterized protein